LQAMSGSAGKNRVQARSYTDPPNGFPITV